MTVDKMVNLAKAAIAEGRTRGQFIREFTLPSDSKAVLQEWSDAFSIAMSTSEGTRPPRRP